jgi:hypothetical protein
MRGILEPSVGGDVFYAQSASPQPPSIDHLQILQPDLWPNLKYPEKIPLQLAATDLHAVGQVTNAILSLSRPCFPIRNPIQTTSHSFVLEDVALLHKGYGPSGPDLSKNPKYLRRR